MAKKKKSFREHVANIAAKSGENVRKMWKHSPFALDENTDSNAVESTKPDSAAEDRTTLNNPFVLTEDEAAAVQAASGAESDGESAQSAPTGQKKAAPSNPFVLTEEEAAAVQAAVSDPEDDGDPERPEDETPADSTDTAEEKPNSEVLEPSVSSVSAANPPIFDPPKRRHKHHWYGIPVGMLVICFALIGAGWLCVQGYRYVYNFVTDDSAERAYDAFLMQVVMLDPEPFESLNAADKNMILRASTWKTVDEVLSGATYESDEQGRVILAGELVRTNAVKLFGVDCILPDGDFKLSDDDNSAVVSYDVGNDQYHVPLIDIVGTYQPYTISVRKKQDRTLLKVAYCVMVDSGTSSMEVELLGKDRNLAVVKYMEYELRHDSDTNMDYIAAIRAIDE